LIGGGMFDVVFIVTPPSAHYKIASYFIKQGVPKIYVDKPLIANAEEYKALMELAQKSLSKIIVAYVLRYSRSLSG